MNLRSLAQTLVIFIALFALAVVPVGAAPTSTVDSPLCTPASTTVPIDELSLQPRVETSDRILAATLCTASTVCGDHPRDAIDCDGYTYCNQADGCWIYCDGVTTWCPNYDPFTCPAVH